MNIQERSVDNMDIFVKNVGIDLYDEYGNEMTPYHRLMDTNDFSRILEDIEKGYIPTNTGKPFPVYESEKLEQFHNNPFGGKDNIFLNR